MTATATADLVARLAARRQPQALELGEVLVGKDILELVSSAMYVDPMTVYREYIQNSADGIDAARKSGLLSSNAPGRIEIAVDPQARSVRIRDNGSGIEVADFARKLTALGASDKRGTNARGFRGVGRLAGLGYAQELIFRSRAAGEFEVSELRWDCRKLKAAIRDTNTDLGADGVIRAVTTLSRSTSKDEPAHFFEVEMRGIVRLKSDRLMNPAAIGDYLSQVAPVPFSPDFRFGEEITRHLSAGVELGTLDIRVNGASEPIYRPHRDEIALDNKGSISFAELALFDVPAIDGGAAALGWALHHDYEGALPAAALMKGLRVRVGNIQVGAHALLEELFPEPRFNSWAVGEVHVLDRRVLPNGRRDDFEQNAHFNNLLNHLSPTTRDIARRCRTSSIRRKWEREFDIQLKNADEMTDILSQGTVGVEERSKLARLIEQALAKMTKVAQTPILAESAEQRLEMLTGLRHRLAELLSSDLDPPSALGHLPEEERQTYERVFELIYECSANRVAAKALIDRMLSRLS